MKFYCIHIEKPEAHEKSDPDPWVAMTKKDRHDGFRYITMDKQEAEDVMQSVRRACPDCTYKIVEFEA